MQIVIICIQLKNCIITLNHITLPPSSRLIKSAFLFIKIVIEICNIILDKTTIFVFFRVVSNRFSVYIYIFTLCTVHSKRPLRKDKDSKTARYQLPEDPVRWYDSVTYMYYEEIIMTKSYKQLLKKTEYNLNFMFLNFFVFA